MSRKGDASVVVPADAAAQQPDSRLPHAGRRRPEATQQLAGLSAVQGLGAQGGARGRLAPQRVEDDEDGEHGGGDDEPADHDGRDDAVAHCPVTLNAICDPGGPQGCPDHLWQEERQAYVQQLGHGFPRSWITDGPFHADTHDG